MNRKSMFRRKRAGYKNAQKNLPVKPQEQKKQYNQFRRKGG